MFACKLKIIDSSFNFKENIVNPEINFNRYVSIYIYSDDERNIPKPKKVGDIIRLRRFNFVVSENGELIGHQQKYSNWLVYDGEDDSNKVISYQDIEKNKERVLTKDEKEKIRNLRIWSRNFFRENSVYQITWWNELKEPVIPDIAIKNKEKAVEVDLLLQTKEIDNKNKRVTFIDYKKNVYYLILNAMPVLQIGEVIKLKCVDVFFTKDGRYLKLTPTTSCLLLFSDSLDSQIFSEEITPEKLKALKLISPFQMHEDEDNYFNTRKKVLNKFPFLRNYDFNQHLINEQYLSLEDKPCQIVSMQPTLLGNGYVNKIPVNLLFLRQLLQSNKKEEIDEYLHQRFVIKAILSRVINIKAQDMIKKHCLKCSKSVPLNTKEFECCGVLMDLFFHLILVMKENDNGEDVEIPVYVIVGKNDYFFDLWELIPRPDDYKGFLEWKDIKKFNEKMENLLNCKKIMELVVELQVTNNNVAFLKLKDTILLP